VDRGKNHHGNDNVLPNPIIRESGRWFNTLSGQFLSEGYGQRLHAYFSKYPSHSLDDARGRGVKKTASVEFSVRVPPSPMVENNRLRTWDRRELEERGYL